MRNLIMKSSLWVAKRPARPLPGMWFECRQLARSLAAASMTLFSQQNQSHSPSRRFVCVFSSLGMRTALAALVVLLGANASADNFNGTVQRASMSEVPSAAVLSAPDSSVQQLHLNMVEAWDRAEIEHKVIMLVLGNDNCDRCALLARYMEDPSLSQRINKNFVNLNVSTDILSAAMSIQIDDQYLPAIILIESEGQFDGSLPSDNLLTFRPETYEPLYDWMENLLFYSDQVFAAYGGSIQ